MDFINTIIVAHPATFELIKLIIQFGGAFFIARVTVNWALYRFKSEKIWEKKILTYTDIISSLYEMKIINEEWLHDDLTNRNRPDRVNKLRRENYDKSENKLNVAIALGNLFFSEQLNQTLLETKKRLAHNNANCFQEEIEHDIEVISSALDAAIMEGKMETNNSRQWFQRLKCLTYPSTST
ncbi:hypothetical protein [Xanthobacter autotrophicus]|uniref:hypothetical protein n=1 Tax=Xanthobacter autotrophicus TaxID=280 RepID=UPI0037283AF1